MQPKVFILTGAVQTGKTTALLKWVNGKQSVHGILTPVVNAKRMFMDIATKQQFDMEASDDETNVLKVGRFIFSAVAFERAMKIIVDSCLRVGHFLKSDPLLIIDEIGPLELKGEGLHDAIKTILQGKGYTVLFVIREGLVEKVVDYFALQNATVTNKEDLFKLL